MECITSEGPLLGVRFIPDEETVFHDKKILLDPGDIFLVYSDGITEAQNAEGEAFGLSGIISSFSTALSLREDSGLKALNYSVMQDMLHFTGSAALSDDVSLLTVRYSGNDA